jgi:hypothetical protein
MSDHEKLLLFEHLPLGSTPSEVKRIASNLGDVAPEIMMPVPTRLREASTETEFFGNKALLEFNFSGDSLYAFELGPIRLSEQAGDSLFEKINSFYTERYGEPLVSDGDDPHTFVRDRMWPVPGGEVGIIMRFEGNERLIGWGFQRALNTRPRKTSPS